LLSGRELTSTGSAEFRVVWIDRATVGTGHREQGPAATVTELVRRWISIPAFVAENQIRLP